MRRVGKIVAPGPLCPCGWHGRCNLPLEPALAKVEGRVNQGVWLMIRRFMVMIAIAVALFPMCGDGTDL
jgi:hypothetical protein